MLIEEALRHATDAQIKSEWARRTQAMRKSRKGGRVCGVVAEGQRLETVPIGFGRPYREPLAQAAAPPKQCLECGSLYGHQKWCKAK